MSAIGKLIGDTGSIGKNVFNIVLAVIVLFVAKHFLSDFGLKLYKMYYGIEGMTSSKSSLPDDFPDDSTFRLMFAFESNGTGGTVIMEYMQGAIYTTT